MFNTIFTSFDKNKNPSDEDIQKISPFIYARYLSGHPSTIQTANLFNQYNKIPIVNQYKMVKSQFGGQRLFIKMPKTPKEDTLKQVEYVSEFFKINEEKAKDYIKFMDKAELDNIVKMYTDLELKGNK